jgi:hypothetical protein
MAARTNQRGNAACSCSSVEEDGGRDEEDAKPSPRVSYQDQEVVHHEEEIPSGWIHLNLERDCYSYRLFSRA